MNFYEKGSVGASIASTLENVYGATAKDLMDEKALQEASQNDVSE